MNEILRMPSDAEIAGERAFDNFSNFHNGTTVLKLMLMSFLLLLAFKHNTFSLSYFHGILEGDTNAEKLK